jgi:hypothetical protein
MSKMYISGDAHKAYTDLVKQWSGVPKMVLTQGDPSPSPWAKYERDKDVITFDPSDLMLNPNRIIRTVNPFRLKQEAVLTGALLHEAAHARFSTWAPLTEEQMATFVHPDGSEVTDAEVALAMNCEEARIERHMGSRTETVDLAWTFSAMAAHIMPMTALAADPNQQILDLIQSWILRAGRRLVQINGTRPQWVNDFTVLLTRALEDHLTSVGGDPAQAQPIINTLVVMMTWAHTSGQPDVTPLTNAKAILSVLFPDGSQGGSAQMGSACGFSVSGNDDESDEQGDEAGEGQSGDGKPGDEQGDGEGSASGEGDESGDGEDGSESDTESELAKALASIEVKSKAESKREAKKEMSEAPKQQSPLATSGGAGGPTSIGGNWRNPTSAERDTRKRAEKFLRTIIAPSEGSKTTLTDAPSATVDGAALSAWKAGGMVRDPMFFRRTRRATQPAPPVKIAVLVDVSSSMSVLQRPSALLSWAVSTAAVDLKNFAGRGQQIESTLVQWGGTAEVVQRNGVAMPGIREVPCNQGTYAMDAAMVLVEEQIPGFFSPSERPENKLLIQFTDWELYDNGRDNFAGVQRYLRGGFESGMKMLNVTPHGLGSFSTMHYILKDSPWHGKVSTMTYDTSQPEAVWDEAAKVLAL